MNKFTVCYFDEEGIEQELEADLLEVYGDGNAHIMNCDWEDWIPMEIPMASIYKIVSE